MIPLKFDLSLFVLLALGFIAFTVIGTVSHESGHYLAARCLGYKARLHYGSTSIQSYRPGEMDYLKSVFEKYLSQIKSKQPFPGKERYDEICSRISMRGFWFTLGGPVQTMLTGTIGLRLVFLFRRRYFAVAVLLLIVFKFIPAKQRFTFITAGLSEGVTGYLFWLVWFGKMIMP